MAKGVPLIAADEKKEFRFGVVRLKPCRELAAAAFCSHGLARAPGQRESG